MATKISEREKREHVEKLVAGFDTAMLVTHTLDGGLRSRPLAIAEAREGGTLYFSTAVDSEKVRELERNPNVNVVLQDGRRFVSLSGSARVVRDKALIERMWSASWKIWFPQGKDDPTLCLLAVDLVEAAYWDMSGTKGLRYVYEMAQAYLTNTRPPSDDDERHTGHVKL